MADEPAVHMGQRGEAKHSSSALGGSGKGHVGGCQVNHAFPWQSFWQQLGPGMACGRAYAPNH